MQIITKECQEWDYCGGVKRVTRTFNKEFCELKIGNASYHVLPENMDKFAARLTKANKPMKTGREQFDAELKAQTKLTATPAERARAELYREFDIFVEPDHVEIDIPCFTELLAA